MIFILEIWRYTNKDYCIIIIIQYILVHNFILDIVLFNIVLYRHAKFVTSASDQNLNSGDMVLYK